MTDKEQQDIAAIAAKSMHRATLFQLTFFVLGSEPTVQGKLQKCADELSVRQRSIAAAQLEIDELTDRLADLKVKIATAIPNQKRGLQRRLQQTQATLADVNTRLVGLEEECRFFLMSYESLEQREKHRNWDDEEVQLEYWSAKIERDIKERIALRMPLDLEVVRSALRLPDQANVKKLLLGLLDHTKIAK